jgi:hypothetical protein
MGDGSDYGKEENIAESPTEDVCLKKNASLMMTSSCIFPITEGHVFAEFLAVDSSMAIDDAPWNSNVGSIPKRSRHCMSHMGATGTGHSAATRP